MFSKVPCKKLRLTLEERRFWRGGIYEQVREVMPLQGSLSRERMCELARVSRAARQPAGHARRPFVVTTNSNHKF
jgi:hypothetical protein